MTPGTKGQSTFRPIRYTYGPGTCMYVMNTSQTWRRALGFSIYDVLPLVCRIFCRTAGDSTCTRRYNTRAIPYEYVFVPRQRTLSVRYSAYALCLMSPLMQPSEVFTGTRTDNPYWPCLTSHIRVIFAVSLCYYCRMLILVFYVMLPVVWWAKASASIQMAKILCRP